jgi:hypothetical protein
MEPLIAPPGALSDALLRLRDAVRLPQFDLTGPDRQEWRERRDRVARDIGGHVARLEDIDAPLLVVFGGVTGAGKSTAVNTLVGHPVVTTGVLRPTTYAPTLATHPDDAAWFTGDRILPALPRAESRRDVPAGGRAEAGVLRIVRTGELPPGLALVDAPDVDSISTVNRDLADQLLDAADVWLWFTTAGKYADEESMRYLRRARERNTALAVALTQIRTDDVEEVVVDFRAKLAGESLGDVDLFVVPSTTVVGERLPDADIAPLRTWLWSLSAPAARRGRRRQTLDGALAALPGEVGPLVDGVESELRAVRTLSSEAGRAYANAAHDFAAALEQGLPLQQEVLGRWNRFVGTGRFLRLAEEATGQARDWIRNLLTNVTSAEEHRLEREVRVEVADTVTGLVVQLADLAAADIADQWARTPAGRDLVAARPDLGRSAPHLRDRADAAVRDWQATVVELVETKGAERKMKARWVSTVVNAAATGAILLALAHTGGLTGAEAGIATAAGAANQTLLVKLLGANNLRWLIARAKEDLVDRFENLMTGERHRFIEALADAAPDPEVVDVLADALVAVESARVARA